MFAVGRLFLFFFAGCLTVVNLYHIERIFDNQYITENGLEKQSDVSHFYMLAEFTIFTLRTFFGFMVMIRLIQVPTKAPNSEQQGIDDGVIWSTFMAIMLTSLGTNTYHNLWYETFRGIYLEEPHSYGLNFSSSNGHAAARAVVTIAKFVALLWGTTQVIINTGRPDTFKFDRNISWHKWFIGLLDCSVFLLGMVYNIYNAVVMHPQSISVKNESVQQFLTSWQTEFYLFQATEFTMGTIGLFLTFYAYFMYEAKASPVTVIALSHGYRLVFLGLFTSASATWHAHCMEVYQHGSSPGVTIFASAPLVYFLVVSVITTIYRVGSSDLVRVLRDTANMSALMGVRIFHLSGSVLFWRLGNAFCIFAMIHVLVLGFSEWIHVVVRPGTVVTNVEHVVFVVEDEILDAGESAFNVLKELDPCRWSIDDNDHTTQLNEDITYSYGVNGINRERNFNLKNVDASSNINCQCQPGKSCDCDMMNAIRDNLTFTKNIKSGFINNGDVGQIDQIDKLEDFTEDKDYAAELQKCHNIECDVVLGAAIAAETALLGSDFLWIFGPAESVVADAAWFAQQANRIGHNVIKYGYRLAKTVTGLVKRVASMKPMIETFKFLSRLETVVHFTPGFGELLVMAPIIIQGLFSIIVGMFKRENVNTAIMEVTLVTKTYIPMTLVSWSMTALVFALPPLVERIIKTIPEAIIRSTIKETHSIMMLRYVFILGATGSTFVLLSSVLTALDKVRQSGNRFLKLAREPANALFGRKTGARRAGYEIGTTDGPGSGTKTWYSVFSSLYDYVDEGWFHAFLTSCSILVLLAVAIHSSAYLLAFHYGPTDMFIGTLGSLRAHATIHGHSSDVAQVSREGLCGLIGKGVEAAIKEAVKEMETIFGTLEKSLEHFVGAIEQFLGLTNLFDKLGRVGMNIFDDTWYLIEYGLAFGVPIVNMLIFGFVSFAKKYYIKKGREEDAQYLADFCLSLTETLLYYNIVMLIMVHQVYGILRNADFKLFYIGMDTGMLFSMAVAAIIINGLSIGGITITDIYPLRR